MGTWTKLSREAQLAILATALASSSTLACSLCRPFVVCDPPPPTPTLMICDPPPPSPATPRPRTATPVKKATPTPTMVICDPPPPSPTPTITICDPPPAPPATSGTPTKSSALPLPRREEVRIVQMAPGTLDFAVERPAPGGDVQWTVSGGALAVLPDDGVRWEPPDRPGRYLLQAVVDWGVDGLAVHSLVLTVIEGGAVFVG